jgi:serine/threonine protein kinase
LGGQRVDDYLLGELAGVGLTGSVYLATAPARPSQPAGRPVALKLLHPARAALLPWASELQGEVHPGLVRYEALGAPVAGRWAGYWVTDVLRGDSFAASLDSASLPDRVAAIADVADAVAALHARGRVHGHLLPQNVHLRPAVKRPGYAPVVSDVGVRLRHDPAVHESPSVALGLYPFLAPEAAAALRAGSIEREPPADVHALGALLAFLLTGVAPGLAEGERTGDEVLRSKARRTYAVGALLDPDEEVDLRAVDDVLLRSLSPRPVDRPSATAFAAALRPARAAVMTSTASATIARTPRSSETSARSSRARTR